METTFAALTPKIVLVPAGLGTLDKSFQVKTIDWSKSSEGYIKTSANGKELTIPLSSILYVESD
ncbi:MAG: hypothetical protein OK438_07005 [Thaumarchaeota archaeon]|nr:hypothetical protein [Nitrososphaerota archaeon]